MKKTMTERNQMSMAGNGKSAKDGIRASECQRMKHKTRFEWHWVRFQ
jgi:hypothetical protein